MDIFKENINFQNTDLIDEKQDGRISGNYYFLIFPFIILVISTFGLLNSELYKKSSLKNLAHSEIKGKEIQNGGKFNILSTKDLSGKIKDTVYTDKDSWLELKINEQNVYQHFRNGEIRKYPISSGNNKQGDPEALESRPGLFAIFLKIEHHKSSQFSAANMYHFMPFNQGIGFHSIDGTGYYANLGVRPSSHGCIRMKHEDAEKLFNDCPTGTLVLATNGYSARTIAFAPEDFENPKEYSKDEYKSMLALNLYNLLNGKYYTEERARFIINPKIIPVSGVYTSYDVKIPEKQLVPRSFVAFYDKPDKLNYEINKEILIDENSEELIKLVSTEENITIDEHSDKTEIRSTNDLIKKYFNNPIGVLPYFGPKR